MYLIHCCKCVLIAAGKAGEGLSPAPVTPTVPRAHLTMNHLIFHKVLGKGSFGKVGPMFPIFKSFPEFNMKWVCDTKMQDTVNFPQTCYANDVTHTVNGKRKKNTFILKLSIINVNVALYMNNTYQTVTMKMAETDHIFVF